MVVQSTTAFETPTEKLFEYLACQKPILAVGMPDSQINQILTDTKAGKVCHFDDHAAMKTFLLASLRRELPQSDKALISQFSRKNLTGKMAGVFDRITSKK